MSHSTGTASRAALEAQSSPGPAINSQGYAVITLSDNLTLTDEYRNCLKIDPTAARDVTLPAARAGLWFKIVNASDTTETITVKNAAGDTIGSLAQNRVGEFFCSDEATPAWYLFHVYASTAI